MREPLATLRRRPIPTWWRDAKLGIFVHWTPASVPAFAPVDEDIGALLRSAGPDALARTPYAEWYENSLRFPDSPVARHHRDTYGTRPYTEFARDWEAGLDQWDPGAWAARFRDTGARYVVFVAKHADGYCLWPTDTPNPHRRDWHSRRDVVGELADAVRGVGLRFGLYYCGGFDWSFDATPIGSMSQVVQAIPRGSYPAYAAAQVRELVDRYRPSVLWNDVSWPGTAAELWPLLAHYYATVPDGVVNDRWMPWNPLLGAARFAPVRRVIDAGARRQATRDGGLVPPRPPHFDHRTPEYVSFPDIEHTPWEYVRGMDRSFAYNACSRPEHFVSRDELLGQFTDVVAKGGNLLLNVGPRGVDAQIPVEQTDRLDWIGAHLAAHGPAIAATRPWVTAGTSTVEGTDVRYTTRDDTVFATLGAATPGAGGAVGAVTLAEVRPTRTTRVELVGGDALDWRDGPAGLVVQVPGAGTDPGPAVVALHDVDARPVAMPHPHRPR